MRRQAAEPAARTGIPLEHRRLHFLVGEARPRAHDRIAEVRARHPAAPIDVQLAREAQAVHLRG